MHDGRKKAGDCRESLAITNLDHISSPCGAQEKGEPMELMRQSYTITRDRGTVIAKALYARKAVRYSTGFAYRNIKDVPGPSPVAAFFCYAGTTIIPFTAIISFRGTYSDAAQERKRPRTG